MNNIIIVFLGGGVGSLARYGVSVLTYRFFKPNFPVATLTSNVLSCVILALAVALFSEKFASHDAPLKLLIVIGFCGGFSTFSSFSFETVELIRSGNMAYAIANILISVAACTGVIFLLTKSNAA